ncbi:FTR1 family protein [Candidatus Woesearchaeota archaeon]|nr:FTR1 family protein [Candidatus Woesearchaeota archaeon]
MDLSSAVITFRETLEAALVVGIMLVFLYRVKQQKFNRYVYLGIFFAVIASIAAAVLFQTVAGGFEGRAEQLFEGSTMVVAAMLLSWMIVWMFRQRMHLKRHVEEKVSRAVEKQEKLELFLLSFVAVFREGVETVIFLGAATFASGQNVFVGGALGIAFALGVSYLFFTAAKKVNLRMFFNITSLLLVLFAAGLVAHGVHEFQEAQVLPMTVEHVWDTNWLLNEKGFLGGLAKSLFGYNGDPSLLEIMAYAAYLAIIGYVFVRMSKAANHAVIVKTIGKQ